MPSSAWPFLDHPGPLAFAHRGGAGDWPENTMPAFERAVSLGYRYVETDVHVTADGVLRRVPRRPPRPRHRPHRRDLRPALVARWPRPASTAPSRSRCSRTCSAPGPTCASTSTPSTTARRRAGRGGAAHRQHRPRVHRLVLRPAPRPAPRRARPTAVHVARATRHGPAALAASWRIPTGRLAAGCAQVPRAMKGVHDRRPSASSPSAHERGLQVHVWTIDDPAEMHELLDLGVDGIMTDRPQVLRERCSKPAAVLG